MKRPGLLGLLHHDVTHRGVTAWALSLALFAFYIALYFTEAFTPVATALHLPNKWVLYGLLYSVAICAGGAWMLRKYRHNRYQIVRTLVVMGVQVSFGFAIPIVLKVLGQPEYYFSYLWPLKIEYFYPDAIASYPLPFVVYGFVAALVIAPLLGVFFGKRWYCSWVCGCGGLANTFGEPWRHLTSKSSNAWRFEKVSIHAVLGLAVALTALVLAAHFMPWRGGLASLAGQARQHYGLIVGAILSGVVGVGLYPLGGTRVWCRNFCPMAAMLGLLQKAGRFRIRVKQDMCISCGMCSKYCEMGIDVRSYAQRNESFTRAACVGCGMCAEVCPRGVLALENVGRAQRRSLPIVGQPAHGG